MLLPVLLTLLHPFQCNTLLSLLSLDRLLQVVFLVPIHVNMILRRTHQLAISITLVHGTLYADALWVSFCYPFTQLSAILDWNNLAYVVRW